MSNLKEVVIYFLVSKLPMIYHPLLSYLAVNKHFGKNNMTLDKLVVKELTLKVQTYIVC
jgi:hypothetical protein